jgi:hypothetical protein
MGVLSACGGGETSGKKPEQKDELKQEKLDGTGFIGIWLDQEDAEELRDTGTLKSQCEKLKEDPKLKNTKIRLIDVMGETYIYSPHVEDVSRLELLGILYKTGDFILERGYQNEIRGFITKVTVQANILKFIYQKDGHAEEHAFVSSTENEVKKYFAAIEACQIP